MKDLKDILSHFSLAGKILEIKPLGADRAEDDAALTFCNASITLSFKM